MTTITVYPGTLTCWGVWTTVYVYPSTLEQPLTSERFYVICHTARDNDFITESWVPASDEIIIA